MSSTDESITIYEADNERSAINLNQSSGLELALKIRNIPKYEFKNILFISEEVKHIIQAFKEVHCYDYILKPYTKKYISIIRIKG